MGLELEPNRCNGLYQMKNPEHCIWAGSHPETRPLEARYPGTAAKNASFTEWIIVKLTNKSLIPF